MSKQISITDRLAVWLDNRAKKDEDGKREITYSEQLERMLIT